MRISKLLSPAGQNEYGILLLGWTLQALDYFSADNWEQVRGKWTYAGSTPWPGVIQHTHAGITFRFDFSPFRDCLQGTYLPSDALQQTRKRLLGCLAVLFEQTDSASRRAFQKVRRDADG